MNVLLALSWPTAIALSVVIVGCSAIVVAYIFKGQGS